MKRTKQASMQEAMLEHYQGVLQKALEHIKSPVLQERSAKLLLKSYMHGGNGNDEGWLSQIISEFVDIMGAIGHAFLDIFETEGTEIAPKLSTVSVQEEEKDEIIRIPEKKQQKIWYPLGYVPDSETIPMSQEYCNKKFHDKNVHDHNSTYNYFGKKWDEDKSEWQEPDKGLYACAHHVWDTLDKGESRINPPTTFKAIEAQWDDARCSTELGNIGVYGATKIHAEKIKTGMTNYDQHRDCFTRLQERKFSPQELERDVPMEVREEPSTLLSQIQKGMQLKKVPTSKPMKKQESSFQDTLARAMAARRVVTGPCGDTKNQNECEERSSECEWINGQCEDIEEEEEEEEW